MSKVSPCCECLHTQPRHVSPFPSPLPPAARGALVSVVSPQPSMTPEPPAVPFTTVPPIRKSKHDGYAQVDDWDAHRQTIARLYLDEEMTLKDVKAYMEDSHGFFATQLPPFPSPVPSQLTPPLPLAKKNVQNAPQKMVPHQIHLVLLPHRPHSPLTPRPRDGRGDDMHGVFDCREETKTV